MNLSLVILIKRNSYKEECSLKKGGRGSLKERTKTNNYFRGWEGESGPNKRSLCVLCNYCFNAKDCGTNKTDIPLIADVYLQIYGMSVV